MIYKEWGKKDGGSLYVKAEGIYGDGGTRSLTRLSDENGNITGYTIDQLDSNANKEFSIDINGTDDTRYRIKDRDLLSYHKFTLGEIRKLAKLDDEDWNKVRKYVKKNPDYSYDQVVKNTGVNP